MRLGPQELLIILAILLLLFGATRLPRLARSLREARDEFQKGEDEVEGKGTDTTSSDSPQSEATPAEGEKRSDAT